MENGEKLKRMREGRASKRFEHDLRIRGVKLANLFLVTIPFLLCWLIYYRHTILMFPSVVRSTGIVFMFVVLYFFFGRTYDAFLVSIKRISEMFYSQVFSILMADSFMYLILWLMSGRFPYIVPALFALSGQLILGLIWCKWAHHWYFRHYGGKKTGIVYDIRREIGELFGPYGLDKKFDVQFSCTVEECLENIQMLDGLEVVFLCGVHSHERNIILKYCVANEIIVYIMPRVGDTIMSGAKPMHMFHLPFLRAGRYSPSPEYVIAKRVFDIAISLLMIVVTSPIMLITAAAIKLEDGGPVLYKQRRLTKNGRVFEIYKFRSMRVDAEKDGVARLSSGEHDSRITSVGRVIRACRIDELPQLFNVLGGSMSVVGPRPERPEIAEQYEKEIPEFSLRLQAKAGLTGYAQIYGKYNTMPYDKLQIDLMYIAKPSFVEDLKIVFATVMILFMKESTEGIEEGQSNALETKKEEESA